MSDKSICITEQRIVDAMDCMCLESLNPDLYDSWKKIVTSLSNTRRGLVNYQRETIPAKVGFGQIGA